MNWFKREKEIPEVGGSLEPDRRFKEEAKQRFLNFYDAYQSSRRVGAEFLSGRRRARSVMWRISGVAAAAFVLLAATSAFADAENVAPTNMLYPMKQLSESVRLAIAPASERPSLELSLAERRAGEINALTARTDAASYGSLVKNLTDKMDDEVSSSLADAPRAPLRGAALSEFCNIVEPVTASSSGSSPIAATSSADGENQDQNQGGNDELHGQGHAYGHVVSILERLSVNQTLSAAAASDCAVLGGKVATGSQTSTSAVGNGTQISTSVQNEVHAAGHHIHLDL